ncbi:MAG: hypothetical protein IKH57_06805 [Clostridia bacterium]|nr:hypothetical protein [Clostridia bacterium]
MSTCAAIIEIGWIKQCFEGDDPWDIITAVSEVQALSCLLLMGRGQEGKKGQKELDKLEKFLEKYHDGTLSMEDIKNLDIHLTAGDIVCHGIAENENEVEALKAQ